MITLLGEPISTGGVYKSVCRGSFPCVYMTQKGKTLKESYQWQAKSQWKKPIIATSIELDIKLYFGTKRRSDWDNFHKLSMDALSGIVWEDDSQIIKATVEKHYSKENPRIEIEIIKGVDNSKL